MPAPFDHNPQRFKPQSTGSSLSEELKILLDRQKKSWPTLRSGYASLSSVRQRTVACGGFDVTLQFNIGRMTSTAAPVDEESVRQRPCFLCVENLPSEQEGIAYSAEFVLLCNPAPIFSNHFTVSHLDHRPQKLEPFLSHFVLLAKDLSPAFSVFYNGPRCGASAPDHMHFQASPAGLIPAEREAFARRGGMIVSVDGTQVFALKEYGRETILLEGSDAAGVVNTLKKLLESLRSIAGSADEPMVNIICSYEAPRWRLLVFPRRKHRPAAFFRNDESRVVVSPAAVDMGGLMITPSEADFNRLDRTMIEEIYAEVSLDPQSTQRILEKLS